MEALSCLCVEERDGQSMFCFLHSRQAKKINAIYQRTLTISLFRVMHSGFEQNRCNFAQLAKSKKDGPVLRSYPVLGRGVTIHRKKRF